MWKGRLEGALPEPAETHCRRGGGGPERCSHGLLCCNTACSALHGAGARGSVAWSRAGQSCISAAARLLPVCFACLCASMHATHVRKRAVQASTCTLLQKVVSGWLGCVNCARMAAGGEGDWWRGQGILQTLPHNSDSGPTQFPVTVGPASDMGAAAGSIQPVAELYKPCARHEFVVLHLCASKRTSSAAGVSMYAPSFVCVWQASAGAPGWGRSRVSASYYVQCMLLATFLQADCHPCAGTGAAILLLHAATHTPGQADQHASKRRLPSAVIPQALGSPHPAASAHRCGASDSTLPLRQASPASAPHQRCAAAPPQSCCPGTHSA